MAKLNWDALNGRRIKKVVHEGDLEWAKQNGLDKCLYLITDKGCVTLDIYYDENTKEPYIAILEDGN